MREETFFLQVYIDTRDSFAEHEEMNILWRYLIRKSLNNGQSSNQQNYRFSSHRLVQLQDRPKVTQKQEKLSICAMLCPNGRIFFFLVKKI